jgi:hypothetical protein
MTKQTISGDRHGNLVIAPQRVQAIDFTLFGDDDDDDVEYFQWSYTSDEFCHILMEADGKLMVSLIGDPETPFLLPFRQGWNEARVYRVYDDAENSYTGTVYAGR